MLKRLSSKTAPGIKHPIKILQFGEGNFLRAFVDYMIDIANEHKVFSGDVVIVKPIAYGSLERFHDQDCRYTVLLRGIENGKPVENSRLITCVQEAVDPYTEYDKYSGYASLESLRFIVSNTTEAGIVLDENDSFDLNPPVSYPGKLTKFLYERAKAFQYSIDKGLIILPVELIDDNGIVLEKCVRALSEKWDLGDRFIRWLDEACVFCSTLVDRIVTGYPAKEAEQIWEKLGYEDQLLDTAEPFGLWVIESQKDISHDIPLDTCGLPVLFTSDQKPYKQRKVRILNGAHTSFVPAAFLCGYDIVLQALQDNMIKQFILDTLFEEVIPTLSLPKDDLIHFAQAVISRFENPFLEHSLLAISLNSVSKWRARCMPSFLEYVRQNNQLPKHLTFSLSALMAFYHGHEIKDGALICNRNGKPYSVRDNEDVLAFFADTYSLSTLEQTRLFLQNETFFGIDLAQIPNLVESVSNMLDAINNIGFQAFMKETFT